MRRHHRISFRHSRLFEDDGGCESNEGIFVLSCIELPYAFRGDCWLFCALQGNTPGLGEQNTALDVYACVDSSRVIPSYGGNQLHACCEFGWMKVASGVLGSGRHLSQGMP